MSFNFVNWCPLIVWFMSYEWYERRHRGPLYVCSRSVSKEVGIRSRVVSKLVFKRSLHRRRKAGISSKNTPCNHMVGIIWSKGLRSGVQLHPHIFHSVHFGPPISSSILIESFACAIFILCLLNALNWSCMIFNLDNYYLVLELWKSSVFVDFRWFFPISLLIIEFYLTNYK